MGSASGMGSWTFPDSLIGSVLERRYEVVRLLGAGGMGAVFEGRHVKLDKRVAVKVLSPTLAADETQRKRFLREARAANRIAHPNVVEIMDFGEEPLTYFVMEYLEGVDLQELIRTAGALPWPRARAIFLQIVSALEAAHREGIVHRDMKPSNCFLPVRRDGVDFVKVLDFGIAKVAESSPDTRGLTRTHEVMGTVAYMAPEQALANPVDHRTDIYAAGVVLFQMLTGKVPFEGQNSYQVLDKHVRAQPPSPREVNAAIPDAAERIIFRALEKDPAARFQSMAEFAAAVEQVASVGDAGVTMPHGMIARPDTGPPTLHLDAPPPSAPPMHRSAPPLARVADSPTGPPDTHPSRHYVTAPPTMFGEPQRRKPTATIALAIGGLLVAVGSAVGIGWYLTRGNADAEPATPIATTPNPAPAPNPAPPPADDEKTDELVIGDDTKSLPNAPPNADADADADPDADADADADADPDADADADPDADPDPDPDPDSTPAPTPKPKPPKPKPKPAPAASTVDSVLAKIRKKALGVCRSGLMGESVVVSFLVRPDGGTSLVKPAEPNHRSAAGACVADMIKSAKFPAGNEGRRTLTVRY